MHDDQNSEVTTDSDRRTLHEQSCTGQGLVHAQAEGICKVTRCHEGIPCSPNCIAHGNQWTDGNINQGMHMHRSQSIQKFLFTNKREFVSKKERAKLYSLTRA